MATPRRIAICPYHSFIEPACERSLRSLEAQGWAVWRRSGSAAIDRERSRLATAALDEGHEAILWVDSDQEFEPNSAERLDEHAVPFASALIARRGTRDFACVFQSETDLIGVGTAGGLLPVQYVGAGFALVRRAAFEAVQKHFALPRVADSGGAIVPYYLPMVTDVTGGQLGYLGEDYAFCERLRRAGIPVLVDTTLRVGHIGRHTFHWEDVLQERARVDGAELALTKKP